MLSSEQLHTYARDGCLVVPDVLGPDEVRALRTVTEEFVERSRAVTAHDDVFDLDDGHSAAHPRVRRIKAPDTHHPRYAAVVRHPGILEILRDLWGPDVRYQAGKLNLKSAGHGAPVEWHQDWAFYPHTNDDLAAVGVMLDDCGPDNGPLMVIPGSHRGPVHDHHAGGRFCGAIDPEAGGLDFGAAVPLTGPAGSVTVHHVRAVHGSAPNVSDRPRRLLLLQYAAADAWPLLGYADIAEFDALMVSGRPTLSPRLERVPVRLPLPPARTHGSIYEVQRGMRARFFETASRE